MAFAFASPFTVAKGDGVIPLASHKGKVMLLFGGQTFLE